MARTFKHALTGRSIRVREDSRLERLVEADDNYTEVKPPSTSKKEASDGSGNAGGRGGSSRKGGNTGRGSKASKSAE